MDTHGSSWQFINDEIPIPSVSIASRAISFWRSIVTRLPWKKLMNLRTSVYDHDAVASKW